MDKLNNVLYVGQTINLEKRIAMHLGFHGHLPIECYLELNNIQYYKLNSKNDAKLYESYYILKYKPKYNKILYYIKDAFNNNLSDLNWKNCVVYLNGMGMGLPYGKIGDDSFLDSQENDIYFMEIDSVYMK